MSKVEQSRPNIEKPRWDQSTYYGRLRHFFVTTNPLNLLCTSDELERARDIVTRYRKGENVDLPVDEIWKAKFIYDSAFHPDTGEKMIVIGRMSAQMPMCTLIGGAMLTFYKSRREVIFCQWFNQSFNAVVNYTNRSGSSPVSVPQLATSYVCATGGALVAALSLNSAVKKALPLIGRLVPFAAIAVANCINIPLMRMKEITEGIEVIDKNGNEVGKSKIAAQEGITAVTISRVIMAAPAFVIPPIIMNHFEKKGYRMFKFRWTAAPIQTLLCGACYIFATPMCCALFPQQASISVSKLEPELQERIRKLPEPLTEVYYNKGL